MRMLESVIQSPHIMVQKSHKDDLLVVDFSPFNLFYLDNSYSLYSNAVRTIHMWTPLLGLPKWVI